MRGGHYVRHTCASLVLPRGAEGLGPRNWDEMPCHHNLEAYLDAYLQAAGILDAKKSPLFRSARGRTGELTEAR